MRILVALSGGIDSSVVAHMLHEEGHELIGVRFSLWTDPLAPALAEILPSKCCNAQTAARTRSVADALGIPLHIVDLEKEFKESVVDPFLSGYQSGWTPNPCIGCNRTIKFGKLLDLMRALNCEKLATGHYARIVNEEVSDGGMRHVLLEAIDTRKDQSYFLYGLSQEQLAHVLFPLGSMLKSDVYALAARYNIPYDEHYRESQDLCFFPEKEPRAFLKRHLKEALRPGNIVRKDGTVVGTHDGIALYTIGQRRGLGIGGLKIPLEVVAKDATHDALIVSEKGTHHTESVELTDLRWISWKPVENMEYPLQYRLRSLGAKGGGTLRYQGGNGTFFFTSPVGPIAPGQSLVLYRDNEILGGGVMMPPR